MGNVEAGLAIQPVEYTERDKIAVARHELGHAVASHFFLPDHAHVRLSIRDAPRRTERSAATTYRCRRRRSGCKFRSQLAADLRHCLGAIACEHVFYGENTERRFRRPDAARPRSPATWSAPSAWGRTARPPDQSVKAVNIGEQLISVAEMRGRGSTTRARGPGAVLQQPTRPARRSRRSSAPPTSTAGA